MEVKKKFGFAHPDLQKQLAHIQQIYSSALAYEPSIPKPPVIDSSIDNSSEPSPQEQLPGLRAFIESVKRDMDVLQKASPQNLRIKNSRLLAEFREIDSYDTDSDSDSDAENRPSLAQTEFTNSILRMGHALLDAARSNILPGTTQTPKIILRLTRLDPDSTNPKEHDARVALTISKLEEMGLEVQLGGHENTAFDTCISAMGRSSSLPPHPSHQLRPTARINLDLSVLIALVSDLTHASLPETPEGASERFVPSSSYLEWRRSRQRSKIYGDKGKSKSDVSLSADGMGQDAECADGTDDTTKHSRALAEQLLQEMQKGLLEEMHDRLSDLGRSADVDASPNAFSDVEFWTTPEARDRCLRIVAKIGGPNEKRRAHALFSASPASLSELQGMYWDGSRFPRNFLPLHPIRIFPSSEPEPLEPDTVDNPTHRPFFRALASTCRLLLADSTAPHPRSLPPELVSGPSTPVDDTILTEDTPGPGAGDLEGEIQRATVMRANVKLTVHTVQSLLWGATRGWTTLTANRGSVRAMMREMKGRGIGFGADEGDADGGANLNAGSASIWIVDPRSLAEGMRSDFDG
ncbi:hypothetical protein EW146_g7546 [Bondarzewia mesenterica]|uniref:DUF1308 domain-containing protein n=1 Tax=Bondarzewia mesenterica TaxID=1095465 RepID=A0A4S4LR50_9AGAM|nr:hypothetical protein EW146_g7546 [Bondarzewia mesenterica]